MNKRGRKPSGVKSEVFFARVTPLQKALLRDYFKGVKVDGALGYAGSAQPANPIPPGGLVMGHASFVPTEPQPSSSVEDLLQTKALLEDIQKLTEEVEFLKAELDGERAKDLDEKASYWRARYLELERKVKDYENSQ